MGKKRSRRECGDKDRYGDLTTKVFRSIRKKMPRPTTVQRDQRDDIERKNDKEEMRKYMGRKREERKEGERE